MPHWLVRNATLAAILIVAFRGNLGPARNFYLIREMLSRDIASAGDISPLSLYVATFAVCRHAARWGQGSIRAIGKNLLFSLEGFGGSLGE